MTYADQVKSEVAARYGLPVLCDVQFIPRGMVSIDATASHGAKARRDAHFANVQRAARLRAAEKPLVRPREDGRRRLSEANSRKLAAEVVKCKAALLGEVDELTRTVLTLRCEGKNFRQIAAETGKAVSMVHGIVKRAGDGGEAR